MQHRPNGEQGVALEVLAEEQIEISGFGGIRERVLVMDPRRFGHHVREECWDVLQLAAGDEWTLDDDAQGYVFRGTAISADGQRLQRGDLFRLSGQSLSLMAESGFALVMIRED
ncbi:MAG: hypothetical protein LRY66_15455 [Saccharospirillaceae bacterium]|nr:hypothetical protein [Saccharospirillaceae bacterium]MCD8532702.1 hypothetical protein [Saccharospirillaceae bacterium]